MKRKNICSLALTLLMLLSCLCAAYADTLGVLCGNGLKHGEGRQRRHPGRCPAVVRGQGEVLLKKALQLGHNAPPGKMFFSIIPHFPISGNPPKKQPPPPLRRRGLFSGYMAIWEEDRSSRFLAESTSTAATDRVAAMTHTVTVMPSSGISRTTVLSPSRQKQSA